MEAKYLNGKKHSDPSDWNINIDSFAIHRDIKYTQLRCENTKYNVLSCVSGGVPYRLNTYSRYFIATVSAEMCQSIIGSTFRIFMPHNDLHVSF